MDDAEARVWNAELDALETTLRDAISSRTRATASTQDTLRRAFRAVDFDDKGYGVQTDTVSFSEFCRALERFGLYTDRPEQAVRVRGLFDRHNPEVAENISYIDFIQTLYAEARPVAVPPKRRPEECTTDARPMLRESPCNSWATSTPELFEHERPVRQLSLANEKHRTASPPPKWQSSSTSPTMNSSWKRA
jgi:hypothetical protein